MVTRNVFCKYIEVVSVKSPLACLNVIGVSQCFGPNDILYQFDQGGIIRIGNGATHSSLGNLVLNVA